MVKLRMLHGVASNMPYAIAMGKDESEKGKIVVNLIYLISCNTNG